MSVFKTISFYLLMSLTALMAHGQKKLTLSNAVKLDRPDEMMVIKRQDVKTLIDKSGLIKVVKAGEIIPLQFDDLNGDGLWDEAIFLYSFKANERADFIIYPNETVTNVPTQRAHVRQRRKNKDDSFGHNLDMDSISANTLNTDFSKVKLPPYLTEGPAWENDKVGFRLYFDVRNGKDIWGKTTSKMMMDTVGVDPAVIYHNKGDWGMDIYKVGASLSAGALAANLRLPSGKDTLIRLGGKNMGRVIYQKISDGPFRAKFRLIYPEWSFAKGYRPIHLTEEITIWGGQYFYSSAVKLENAPADLALVTGFANLFEINSGEINRNGVSGLYSFGLQSENKDNLGLAVLLFDKQLKSFGKTKSTIGDIKNSYLVNFKGNTGGETLSFRFYAAWSASDQRFANLTNFQDYISDQAILFSSPIHYKWN